MTGHITSLKKIHHQEWMFATYQLVVGAGCSESEGGGPSPSASTSAQAKGG
jgi:hypothetical protein